MLRILCGLFYYLLGRKLKVDSPAAPAATAATAATVFIDATCELKYPDIQNTPEASDSEAN